MKFVRFFARRPIGTMMFHSAIAFIGIWSLAKIPIVTVPDLSFPRLSVQASWRGASPEIVESYVTSPIESVSSTVTGVEQIYSVSREGFCNVDITFQRKTAMDFAALELNEKISSLIETLPRGVRINRTIQYSLDEFQAMKGFLSYQLSGPMSLTELRRIAANELRTPLIGIDGVGDVRIWGGAEREIVLELDRNRMHGFGLHPSLGDGFLSDVTLAIPAGQMLFQGKYLPYQVTSAVGPTDNWDEATLESAGIHRIQIRHVGRIVETVGDPNSIVRVDGEHAVTIQIERRADANMIQTANSVYACVEKVSKQLPKGVALHKIEDTTSKFRKSLNTLWKRTLISLLTIFVVLVLFLRCIRGPSVLISTICFSVFPTAALFSAAGIGLNLLTIGGLALGFGMLVDNSMVVMESIHRNRDRVPFLRSVQEGVQAVIMPMTASTFTTAIVLLPFLYIAGTLRIAYLPFAVSVIMSLLASLFVALTLIPTVSRWSIKMPVVRSRSRKLSGFSRLLYSNLLRWILHRPGCVVVLAFIMLATSAWGFFRFVERWHGWWEGSQTYLVVSVRFPIGTEIGEVDRIVRAFEAKVADRAHIARVVTKISGRQGGLKVTFENGISNTDFPVKLKQEFEELAAQFAGGRVSVGGFGIGFDSGSDLMGSKFRFLVKGYDYKRVKDLAEEVARRLSQDPRVMNIEIDGGWGDHQYEVVLMLERGRLNQFDVSVAELLQWLTYQLPSRTFGREILMHGNEVEAQIKFSDYQNFNIRDLKELTLETPSGSLVRLSEISRVFSRRTPDKIPRIDQQYSRLVAFDYRGTFKNGESWLDETLEHTHVPDGFTLSKDWRGSFAKTSVLDVYWAIGFSVLLVYMVTAALYESLLQPIVIILTIPLSLIGIFAIFLITGASFDRTAHIGIVLMVGIVVNNAILLVDRLNYMTSLTDDTNEAVINGCIERARPILMTSVTTIAGLLPILTTGPQEGGFWYSLSIGIVGGLTGSTIFVLTVVPAMYVLVSHFQRRVFADKPRKLKARRAS